MGRRRNLISEKMELEDSKIGSSQIFLPTVISLPPGFDYSDTLRDGLCQLVKGELEAYFESGTHASSFNCLLILVGRSQHPCEHHCTFSLK